MKDSTMLPQNFAEYLIPRFVEASNGAHREGLLGRKIAVDPIAADEAVQAAIRYIAALAADRDERTRALLVDLEAGRDWGTEPLWNDLVAAIGVAPLSAIDRLQLAVRSVERGEDPGALLWPTGAPTGGRWLADSWLEFPPMRERLAARAKFALLLGAGAPEAIRDALERFAARSSYGSLGSLHAAAARSFDQYAAAAQKTASLQEITEATADLDIALGWPASVCAPSVTKAA